MIVSTKGRYALRVLIDLAENGSDDRMIPLKTIAERQEISLKYLEQILPILTRGKLIQGVHGKGGGYRLLKNPSEIMVLDVLKLTEGSLNPVACLTEGADHCSRKERCRTLPLWTGLDNVLNEYLSSVSIDDLVRPDLADAK